MYKDKETIATTISLFFYLTVRITIKAIGIVIKKTNSYDNRTRNKRET